MKYFASGFVSNCEGCCECGRTNTCDVSGLKCNCDANDAVLRSDEAYLDDTEILPIHTFKAGDTGTCNVGLS